MSSYNFNLVLNLLSVVLIGLVYRNHHGNSPPPPAPHQLEDHNTPSKRLDDISSLLRNIKEFADLEPHSNTVVDLRIRCRSIQDKLPLCRVLVALADLEPRDEIKKAVEDEMEDLDYLVQRAIADVKKLNRLPCD